MKERPILFSGPMVRAILAGAKTQTRRVLKNGPWSKEPYVFSGEIRDSLGYPASEMNTWAGFIIPNQPEKSPIYVRCPYGRPGDQLWVRETWREMPDYNENGEPTTRIDYKADDPSPAGPAWPWRPSIHMPRWACRITLEVTGVRVERLQDIKEEDAIAEGVEPNWAGPLDQGRDGPHIGWSAERCGWMDYSQDDDGDPVFTARRSFQTLWESINANRDFGWDVNPWVWVIEFKRLEVKP